MFYPTSPTSLPLSLLSAMCLISSTVCCALINFVIANYLEANKCIKVNALSVLNVWSKSELFLHHMIM